jgi:hypothetical protein
MVKLKEVGRKRPWPISKRYPGFCLEVTDKATENVGLSDIQTYTRVYPKVSGLTAWSENCKWYSSLPLGAVVLLFCESV